MDTDTPAAESTAPYAGLSRIWDLSEIAIDETHARAQWPVLEADAQAFKERWAGRLATCRVREFVEALDEFSALLARLAALYRYGMMPRDVYPQDTQVRDFALYTSERYEHVWSLLRAFNIEWSAVPKAKAKRLLSAKSVAPYRWSLEQVHADRGYAAGEQFERAHALGQSLQTALIDIFKLQMRSVPAGALSHDGPKEQQRRHERQQQALADVAPTVAACFDGIVGARIESDRALGREHPMESALQGDGIDEQIMEQMLSAVERRVQLYRRYQAFRQRLLGVSALQPWHEHLPAAAVGYLWIGWPDSLAAATEAFDACSPKLAETVRTLIEQQHIHADWLPGKAPGLAYSINADTLPYLIVNDDESCESAFTHAHELGHATEYVERLARHPYGAGWAGAGMSEMAAVFAELLLDDHLRATRTDPGERLCLGWRALEASMSSFWRIAETRFEQAAYAARASGQTLTAERLAVLWQEQSERLQGAAGGGNEWAWRHHLLTQPRFYLWAYAFARMLALNLHGHYHDDPDSFERRYLDLLADSCSTPAPELLARFGIDLRSAEPWEFALDQIEQMLDELEAAYETWAESPYELLEPPDEGDSPLRFVLRGESCWCLLAYKDDGESSAPRLLAKERLAPAPEEEVVIDDAALAEALYLQVRRNELVMPEFYSLIASHLAALKHEAEAQMDEPARVPSSAY